MTCENERCPLYPYCLTQKKDYYTCDYMVTLYNAGLLLPKEHYEKSALK